jgi:hypothetical protein
MQELFGSIRGELADDPRQIAATLATFATAWAEMLEKLGLEVEASLTINEGRPKRGRSVGSRLSRRLAAVPSPLGSGHDVDSAA